jgi:hypothetical protein
MFHPRYSSHSFASVGSGNGIRIGALRALFQVVRRSFRCNIQDDQFVSRI